MYFSPCNKYLTTLTPNSCVVLDIEGIIIEDNLVVGIYLQKYSTSVIAIFFSEFDVMKKNSKLSKLAFGAAEDKP